MNASVECKTIQGELNTEKKTGESRVDQKLDPIRAQATGMSKIKKKERG